MSKRSAQNHMQVVVRPEIRKGCVWALQFKFSDTIVNQMSEFSTNEFNTTKTPFLQLTVKSKLLQTELPFSKVAQLLNDGANIPINKSNTAVLNVKFTSRPRTVFHRHSDVMILLAVIKKGDEILCVDELELIFRGGTGSVHSADNKKGIPSGPPTGFVKMEFRGGPDQLAGLKPGDHGEGFYPRPGGEFEGAPEHWPIDLSQKGLPMGAVTPQIFDELMRNEAHAQQWNEAQGQGLPFPHFHHAFQQQLQQQHFQFQQPHHPQFPHLQHLQHLPHMQHPHLQHPHLQHPHMQHPHLQHAQHGQAHMIGQPQQRPQEQSETLEENNKVNQEQVTEAQLQQLQQEQSEVPQEDQLKSEEKKEIESNILPSNGSPQKKIKTEKDEDFKSLFFNCLPFMQLPQLSNMCNTITVPIFVKNVNSEIIYANNPCYRFIGDITGVKPSEITELQTVFNSLLDVGEADNDKFVLTQPEREQVTSDVVIRDISCQFVKQWSNLPDGQTVIIVLVENIQTQNLSTNGGAGL